MPPPPDDLKGAQNCSCNRAANGDKSKLTLLLLLLQSKVKLMLLVLLQLKLTLMLLLLLLLQPLLNFKLSLHLHLQLQLKLLLSQLQIASIPSLFEINPRHMRSQAKCGVDRVLSPPIHNARFVKPVLNTAHDVIVAQTKVHQSGDLRLRQHGAGKRVALANGGHVAGGEIILTGRTCDEFF